MLSLPFRGRALEVSITSKGFLRAVPSAGQNRWREPREWKRRDEVEGSASFGTEGSLTCMAFFHMFAARVRLSRSQALNERIRAFRSTIKYALCFTAEAPFDRLMALSRAEGQRALRENCFLAFR